MSGGAGEAAQLKFSLVTRLERCGAELPLAVVAAHSQTLDDGSAQATLAAIIKRLVVCGGHSESQLA